MAKSKKTPDTGSSESPAPAAARKPARKPATKAKKSGSTSESSPSVDTAAAARLAAMMVGKKIELPAGGTSGRPSQTIQQLKQPPGIPGISHSTTQSILGTRKPSGHASNQQGHNQTIGHDRSNVPRRTGG